MKIFRDTEGDVINQIVNQTDQGQTDYGPVDLRPLVKFDDVYALFGDPPFGTHICLRVIDGVFEFHSAVASEGRGEWTIEFTEGAIEYMFTQTSCIELITRIPQGNVAAAALARRFGFSPRWAGSEMKFKDKIVPYAVWSLTMFEWLPSGHAVFEIILNQMREAGQELKAQSWEARRNVVSRPVF